MTHHTLRAFSNPLARLRVASSLSALDFFDLIGTQPSRAISSSECQLICVSAGIKCLMLVRQVGKKYNNTYQQDHLALRTRGPSTPTPPHSPALFNRPSLVSFLFFVSTSFPFISPFPAPFLCLHLMCHHNLAKSGCFVLTGVRPYNRPL